MMINIVGDKIIIVFFLLWVYNEEYGEEIKVV